MICQAGHDESAHAHQVRAGFFLACSLDGLYFALQVAGVLLEFCTPFVSELEHFLQLLHDFFFLASLYQHLNRVFVVTLSSQSRQCHCAHERRGPVQSEFRYGGLPTSFSSSSASEADCKLRARASSSFSDAICTLSLSTSLSRNRVSACA